MPARAPAVADRAPGPFLSPPIMGGTFPLSQGIPLGGPLPRAKVPHRGLEPHAQRLAAAKSTRSLGKIDCDEANKQHAENRHDVHG